MPNIMKISPKRFFKRFSQKMQLNKHRVTYTRSQPIADRTIYCLTLSTKDIDNINSSIIIFPNSNNFFTISDIYLPHVT